MKKFPNKIKVGVAKKKNNFMMKAIVASADGYEAWIRSIKERVQRARIKATMLANSEQILLYWDIGHDILAKQNSEGWGTKVVERMSADLKMAFPDMKGWSRSNLMYMRQFAEAWTRKEIVQVPLGQLPWYHHLALLECLKSRGDRIAYAALAIIDGKTIGILLCKSRNEIVAEYSLADLDRPIGVSTYRLGLPSLEQLQAQLRKALAVPGIKGAKR